MMTAPRLYPGEQIRTANGFPSLVTSQEGDPSQPLVVFIPGAGHLGRIASGHPEGSERDFLAYWIAREGSPFLAISYPLEHPIYPDIYPAFSIQDWGRQAAEITRQVIREHALTDHVICLAWSMAGHICQSFYEAATSLQVRVDLFIGLVASAPLPFQNAGLDDVLASTKMANGMASGAFSLGTRGGRRHDFLASLAEQGERNNHVIIPREIYPAEFIGNQPIDLWGTPLRYQDGQWVPDLSAALTDLGSFAYEAAPLVGLVLNNHPSDDRHGLTDQGACSQYLVHKLHRSFVVPHGATSSLPPGDWQRLIELVREAPTFLSMTVGGKHFLLVGEVGARAIARCLLQLKARARLLTEEIAAILNPP